MLILANLTWFIAVLRKEYPGVCVIRIIQINCCIIAIEIILILAFYNLCQYCNFDNSLIMNIEFLLIFTIKTILRAIFRIL